MSEVEKVQQAIGLTSSPAERLLAEHTKRYAELAENIQHDQREMEELKEKTGLRYGFHKRDHERIKERQQVEYYKRDELRLVAGRAGIKL